MASGQHEPSIPPSIAPSVYSDPEVLPPRPDEAAPETAPRRPLALLWTYVVGFAMGAADVVPAFSGGTVALVAGIYERLVANIRQGAHVLSLLVRGKVDAAVRAFVVIEWPFIAALVTGIGTAVLVLSATLNELLDRFPMPMSAAFLGLILGAAAVAQRELRSPAWYHAIIAFVVAGLVFVGLAWSPGAIDDPSLPLVFGAVAVAACAMILPGVSGAFLLVVLGMYAGVVTDGFGQRDVPVMLTAVLGAATGLALFSTALNYLLRRWHDLILAALLGLMLGSARVLWPWPDGMDSPELAMPVGNEGLLAFSIGLTAFATIWLLALVIPSSKETARRAEQRARDRADDPPAGVPGDAPGEGPYDAAATPGPSPPRFVDADALDGPVERPGQDDPTGPIPIVAPDQPDPHEPGPPGDWDPPAHRRHREHPSPWSLPDRQPLSGADHLDGRDRSDDTPHSDGPDGPERRDRA